MDERFSMPQFQTCGGHGLGVVDQPSHAMSDNHGDR